MVFHLNCRCLVVNSALPRKSSTGFETPAGLGYLEGRLDCNAILPQRTKDDKKLDDLTQSSDTPFPPSPPPPPAGVHIMTQARETHHSQLYH
jgi:hypothetical protein